MSSALVVHASKHGSTTKVAQRVADRLRSDGVDVTVASAREVRDPVASYDLVVVGGAIYNGRWYADARRFLKRHRAELTGTPVAVFGMGPREDDPEAWRRSRAQLDRSLAKTEWVHPVAVAVFGGVDPKAKRDAPPRDLRDWEAIDAWAAEVAGRL